MTGVVQPMIDLVRAVEPLAPNFAGVKYTGLYTSPGFMDAMEVMAYKGGKFEVFSGREEMMLEALSIGIKGHVGSQFNFAGDLYNAIRSGFAADGLTPRSQPVLRAMQLRAVKLVHAWKDAAPEGVNGAKFFMNAAGVPVGGARLPSLPVDDAATTALNAAFRSFCKGGAEVAATAVEAADSATTGQLSAPLEAMKMCDATVRVVA
jgi:Dihydrodipicolinate synthase/N-acetylneuraminate lyase